MDVIKAIQILGLHSRSIENHEAPRFLDGFVGALCPYRGTLPEENFDEVMTCLFSLVEFVRQPSEGTLAAARDVHRLLDRARHRAREQQDEIPDEEVIRLDAWLAVISETWMHILESAELEAIHAPYQEYRAGNGEKS